MLTSPRLFVALGVGVVVLIVVGVAAYLLLPPRQTGSAAVSGSSAAREQIVTAYLDALNAHDCRTAEALMTAEARGTACR